MCGIFGIIVPKRWDVPNHDLAEYGRMFTQLCIANSKRGEDATGVFSVRRNGKITVYKEPIPVWHAIYDRDWQSIVSMPGNTFALIGHTRAKSKESFPNDVDNAHPHLVDDILGVHNGTIENYTDFYPEYPSDSMALFKFIRDRGLNEFLTLQGAAAVCYLDLKVSRHIFNFFACERPLHYAFDNGVFIFSSEEEAVHSVARNHVKVVEIKEGNLLTLNARKGCNISTSTISKLAKFKNYNGNVTYPEHYRGQHNSYVRSYIPGDDYGSVLGEAASNYKHCKKCAIEIKSELILRSPSQKLIARYCNGCPPNACSKCNRKAEYGYKKFIDNTFYLTDPRKQTILCRTCFTKWSNTKILKCDANIHKKCNGCNEFGIKNQMTAFETDVCVIFLCKSCTEEKLDKNREPEEEKKAKKELENFLLDEILDIEEAEENLAIISSLEDDDDDVNFIQNVSHWSIHGKRHQKKSGLPEIKADSADSRPASTHLKIIGPEPEPQMTEDAGRAHLGF